MDVPTIDINHHKVELQKKTWKQTRAHLGTLSSLGVLGRSFELRHGATIGPIGQSDESDWFVWPSVWMALQLMSCSLFVVLSSIVGYYTHIDND